MVTAAAVRVMEAGVPYPRPNERAVVRLWSNAHNLSEGLRAEDGSRFRVLYPGRPGGGAGPDFRDAVLQKESGETVRGDVEVHVEESGWRAHRHHVDPGYNGVVLHLVLHAAGRKATRQESGAGAPVARLPKEARERDDGPLPEPFAALVGGEPLGEALDRAGDRRFMARSAGFRAELERADPDEAAYGAVMEALGYAANRKPFRELARLVPFGRLVSMRREPETTRLLALEAMLVRGAGLLPHVDSERSLRLRAVLDHLPRTPSMPSGMWQMAGARPANHPLRRLTGAVRILDGHLERGLMRGLAAAAACGSRALADTLSAKPYVGAGRSRDISVTVALPLVHAWAGLRRDRKLENAVPGDVPPLSEATGERGHPRDDQAALPRRGFPGQDWRQAAPGAHADIQGGHHRLPGRPRAALASLQERAHLVGLPNLALLLVYLHGPGEVGHGVGHLST